MIKQLVLFLAGVVVAWAVVFAVAWVLWPDHQESSLVCSLAAMALCLIPTVPSLLLSTLSQKQSPQMQLIAVLGGTGVRMFFVLGLGLLLSISVPALAEYKMQFWLWVLAFYLITLALEMTLILRAQVSVKTAPGGLEPPSSVTP